MSRTCGAGLHPAYWGARRAAADSWPECSTRIRERIGELLLKAASSFKGYYRNPEATAETFRRLWCAPGDVAEANGDGSISSWTARRTS